MSKLASLIRRLTAAEAQPLGFASARRTERATMALVAFAAERWAQQAADAIGAGADALVLSGRPGDNDITGAVSAAGDRPCGVVAGTDAASPGKIAAAGADFAVVEPQTPAAALSEEKLGYVLHSREELSDVQLRTIEPTSIEALLIDPQTSPMTILRQLELRRLSGLARKPLIAPISHDATQEDLLALRDAGAVLVAIEMKDRGAAAALERLRAVIDGLPRPKVRRDQASEATLPRLGMSAATSTSDDDEDEDGE